jgi:hypothetical protein
MASQPQQRFNISDGPGKFDLMVALFDDGLKTVRFSFGVPYESRRTHTHHSDGVTHLAEVSIRSVERSLRTEDDWVIRGRVRDSSYTALEVGKGIQFDASFSTRTREGTITFAELTPAEQCA